MTGKQRLSISTKSVTNKKLLFFFLSAFFLTQIYPFYITGAHSSLLSTLSLGKIFISVTFFIVLYSRKKELLNLYSSKKVVFTILGLFLFGESLSVLSVNDVYSFFKIYHNTILAILIFMLTAFFIKSNKNNIVVFRTFISISAISYIVFELIFRLFFSSVFPIFSQYAQKEIVDAYLYNISIFKYSLAQGPEMFLPFLLYPIASRHVGINKKALYAITSLTLFFLSMLSIFRSRVLIYFFGVFTFFCINISKKSLTVMSKKNWSLYYQFLQS